jgi:hypothetical protein
MCFWNCILELVEDTLRWLSNHFRTEHELEDSSLRCNIRSRKMDAGIEHATMYAVLCLNFELVAQTEALGAIAVVLEKDGRI